MRLIGAAIAVLFLAIGCRPAEQAQEEPRVPGAEEAQDAQDAREAPEPASLTAVTEEIPGGGVGATDSDSGESDPACVGRLELDTPETLEIEGWKIEVNGYRMKMERTGEGREELSLGVIADIKEDTGENMFNIGRFIEWWRAMNVDAIVVAGDAGETVDGLARVLGALAEPGWPVLVISGNREAKAVYVGGVEKAEQENRNVFNMAKRRLIELPGATLISLPGYHDPRYLHEETGCQYFREDVEALVPVAREAAKPVVLVAHSGPRGATPNAIDYAREAENVGDGNINRLIHAAQIPFGIFGHIHEAGGKATDLLGHDLRSEGSLTNSLYLNAGPADSHRWLLNDGTESTGMAGVLRIKGQQGTYLINRVPRLSEEQIAQARLLDAPSDESEDAE